MKKSFDLVIDERVKVWRRSYITIEADSLEEAVQECTKYGTSIVDDISDSFYIDETEEILEPSNYFTIEVMERSTFKPLGNNSIKNENN